MDPRMTSRDVAAVAQWHRAMQQKARDVAREFRFRAVTMANAGNHQGAIECTSRAQVADRTAEEWGRSAEAMEREAEARRPKPRPFPDWDED